MRLFIYYLIKTILLITYISTIVYSWQFFFKPAITVHGLSTVLWTMLCLFIIAFLTSSLFFFMRKPRQPQATFKSTNLKGMIT